jgi:hypothetical protein
MSACRFLLALCFAIAICLLFIIFLIPYIYIIAHGRDTSGHSLSIFSKKTKLFLIEIQSQQGRGAGAPVAY